MVLFEVIIPVFLIFLAGYAGQKVLRLDIKSVSTTTLYLMAPALVFRSIYEMQPGEELFFILTYVVLLSVFIVLLINLISRLRGYDPPLTSALILSTAFMNNGNLGAPVILFAFGEKAFQYAVIIMVFHTILMSTLGLYYAAKGRLNVRDSLFSVLKMPIVHAFILALVWQSLNLPMPENIYKAIGLVANAAIPAVMLVLGMQLAEIKLESLEWGKTGMAISIRLLVSPLIALVITMLLPVEPLLGKVMIVEAAMPTAAITTMYALQFDTKPGLVSSITFLSTLISIITLSVLLTLI